MTDELKIFGKALERIQATTRSETLYEVAHGLFRFQIAVHGEEADGYIRPRGMSPLPLASIKGGPVASVIAGLENEARRIMRECLEIAGPMFTEEPCGIGPQGEFMKRVPVRF